VFFLVWLGSLLKHYSRFLLFYCVCASTVVAAPPDYEREVLPFLKQHCYTCHDAKQAKAGFRIDELGMDFLAGTTAENWHEVINQINSGEMPPKDEPRPDAKAAFAVVGWVGAKLKDAERQARMAGGRILTRRLNRQEYANTVGDLFQLDPHFVEKLKRELPADGKAEGFDRISNALFFDQTQMLGYLDWAGQIASEAVQSAPPQAETYVYEAEKHLNKNDGPTVEVAQAINHQIPLDPLFITRKPRVSRCGLATVAKRRWRIRGRWFRRDRAPM